MAKLAFLGISFGYHDSAVSAVDANGQIVFAEHEERLSRIKHDNRFPINALENCASYLYKHEYAIEAIGYYENQFLKETRQLLDIFKYIDANPRLSSSKNTQGSPIIEHLANAISTNISCSAYSLEETIAAEVKSRYPKLLSSRVRCVSYDHHLSHAAGAFFSSPFDDSIILSMDGAGEFETVTIWSGRKEQNTLRKLWSAQLPFSLGLFYSAITSYLGFSVNEGEYKVMGLSAYGRPDYVRFFSDIIGFSDGTATVDADFFNFGPFSERLFTDKFVSSLPVGPADNTKWVEDITDEKGVLSEESMFYCSLAMSAQKVLTSIQVSMVRFAQGICPSVNLCMTGGVALNTLANLEIDNLVQGNIFVYPPSGDAGSSAGAAYLALLNNCPEVKIENKRFNPFLGSETSPSEYITHVTRSAAVRSGYYNYRILENSERMKWVADKLLKREIVALHQSRAEFGPRALGNRSILASGLHPEMKEKLNRYIKKREAYRPYAPAIAEDLLADNLHVSLSLEGKISHPLYYMASVIRVPDEAKELYPSAVHYDNTARVQLLSKELNPSLYELSHILFNACGCGLVLNTSLNLGYEALVGSVESALATLSWSDFSFALLGNVALEK